ncbi:MAG: hypothetical protein EOP93_08460 [Lysobacteraceae bacterium]|nr:MAG: hypothetical protein EOP93_08460 [Xanthomonadaceae bacterium]
MGTPGGASPRQGVVTREGKRSERRWSRVGRDARGNAVPGHRTPSGPCTRPGATRPLAQGAYSGA